MNFKFERSAFRVSLLYWAIATGWVVFTSLAIAFMIPGYRGVAFFEISKACVFVVATSILVYLLTERHTRRLLKESAEHARAEEALRKSESRLKAAQQLAHIGNWEWDPTRRKVAWSDEMFQIFRINPEDFTGDPSVVRKRIHPGDLQRYLDVMDASMQKGSSLPHPVEFRIIRPDGEVRWLVSSNLPAQGDHGNADHVVGVVQDITEIRRRESALRESEARLKEAERLAHLGTGSWDPNTDRTVWSDEMYRIVGKDPSLPPPSYSERPSMYTTESWVRFEQAVRNSIEAGVPYDLELQVRRPNGALRDVRVRGALNRNENGGGVRLVGTMQDITDWKKTVETLRLQASALQSAANAMVITDRSGAIMFVNSAFTQLTGYSDDEVIGRSPRILKSGNQPDAFYKNLWDTISSGKVWRGHLVNRRKDGTLYHEEQTITPVRTRREGITHFVGIKQDITERIHSEETARSSMTQLHALTARLEEIREEERKSLSHEVHDELGQVLTVMKMNILSLQESGFSDKGEYRSKIDVTVRLLDEAMETVRDISARLRPGALDYLGLIPAIEWLVEQFRRNSRVQCEVSLPQSQLMIDEARSTVLFRVLQEALTNTARHAHARNVKISLSETDDEFVMTVGDDGVGIQPAQIDSPRSFGLLGIRERLYPFWGRCVIRRGANGGTEIIVNLPKDMKRRR